MEAASFTLDSVGRVLRMRYMVAARIEFVLPSISGQPRTHGFLQSLSDTADDIIQGMSRSEKRLARMRNNPQGWVLDDLIAVANQHGIQLKNQVGSHATFSHPSVREILTVPAKRPIKSVYVKKFVAMVDEVSLSRTSKE